MKNWGHYPKKSLETFFGTLLSQDNVNLDLGKNVWGGSERKGAQTFEFTPHPQQDIASYVPALRPYGRREGRQVPTYHRHRLVELFPLLHQCQKVNGHHNVFVARPVFENDRSPGRLERETPNHTLFQSLLQWPGSRLSLKYNRVVQGRNLTVRIRGMWVLAPQMYLGTDH